MNNFSKRKRNVKYKERCTHTPIERTIYVERDTYRERESEQKLYKERERENERERERMNSNPKEHYRLKTKIVSKPFPKCRPTKHLQNMGTLAFQCFFSWYPSDALKMF